MRYCPRCGVPRILTSEHKWGSNGTISLANDPTHHMVIVDNDALNHVLDSISVRIGMPVDNIVAEAKRRSGKHFMDAVLRGIKGVVARNLISTKVYEQLSKQVSMLGLGHARVAGYRKHSFLEGVAEDVYNGPAMAGDVCGAFESVEKRVGEVEFGFDDDGTFHLVVNAVEGQRPEYVDRFHYQPPPVLPGRNVLELCPVCKAPLTIGLQYSFDMDRGIIREIKTGHRVVLIGVMTLNNLFNELEAELGEEIPRVIMNIERERVKNVILEKGKELDSSEAGYLRYMKTLQPKGMGNGTHVSTSDMRVTARVDNPYFEPLVAGFLAGFYEATGGVEAKVEWTDSQAGYVEVTLEPA